MSETHTARPARRLALEAVVIILSILVAFTIDAWWDGRQEDRVRGAMLRSLQRDLADIQVEVDRMRGSPGRGITGVEATLAIETDRPPTVDDALRVDSILAGLLIAPTFDAPMGAAQALISGGDLSYIESEELVSGVTRLLSWIANVEREQARLEANFEGIVDLLDEFRIDLSGAIPVLGRGTASSIRPAPTHTGPTDFWRWVTDPRIRTAATKAWYYDQNALDHLDRLEDEITTLNGVIQERLSR